MIIYAATAFSTLVVITLGMAACGWYRHLHHHEYEPLPSSSEQVNLR
ncbi:MULTISPECIES: hypothetical protein [unclassified Pseudomonas]|nr:MULTISPECIES: hypothetical protein [unclassified Pseudomonas]MDX9668014.1 hypothetical protein [Pseudomonas sp. P5_152]